MPRAWDAPDVFKQTPLQRFDVVPLVTGTAYSSHPPSTVYFCPVNLDYPVQVAQINVFKSFNASVPDATSQNSSGSEGYSYTHGVSIYSRQDYAGNSSNLSAIATASVGVTATLSYSSGSQSFGLSWVTNTTGGTSGISTTSGAGNWSSSVTGAKVVAIPWVATLSAGEYWLAHQHSSTASTSGSAVTLLSLSNLHVAPLLVTFGVLGGSASVVSAPTGIAVGVATGATTSATMAGSVVSPLTVNLWAQELSVI